MTNPAPDIEDPVPVWIYAGPKAGTVQTLSRRDGLYAETQRFGEILRNAAPKHGIERGPHKVAEEFYADRNAGHGYLDRQMRAGEPPPVPSVPDPVPAVADRSTPVAPQRSALAKKRGRPRKS